MTKFPLYNPFYGPIGSKCSVNKYFTWMLYAQIICSVDQWSPTGGPRTGAGP